VTFETVVAQVSHAGCLRSPERDGTFAAARGFLIKQMMGDRDAYDQFRNGPRSCTFDCRPRARQHRRKRGFTAEQRFHRVDRRQSRDGWRDAVEVHDQAEAKDQPTMATGEDLNGPGKKFPPSQTPE